MRSAPTLKIWMTPFSSVAMLEKLALLKIAFCKAPAFIRASLRRASVTTFSLPAAAAGMAESRFCADMFESPSSLLTECSHSCAPRHALCDLPGQVRERIGLERSALNAVLGRFAIEGLHHDEKLPVVLVDFVNRADARVI